MTDLVKMSERILFGAKMERDTDQDQYLITFRHTQESHECMVYTDRAEVVELIRSNEWKDVDRVYLLNLAARIYRDESEDIAFEVFERRFDGWAIAGAAVDFCQEHLGVTKAWPVAAE